MPLFKLIETQTIITTIETEAEDANEATEKYASGDCWTIEIEEFGPDLTDVIAVD